MPLLTLSPRVSLRRYQLAYKRLTVLAELQRHMEPLDVGKLQGAIDTALQVKMVDPLVDAAVELLKNIDRETSSGAFAKPYDAGGAYGGNEWLGNPHFKVSFKEKEGAPGKVRISITCAEGKGGGDDTDYFGAFAIHLVRNADKQRTREAQPGFELLASSDYSMDTAVLTVDDIDTAHPFFIVPSTQVANEEGPFVLNVICETPGADLVLEPVVQVGDLVLDAIARDDLLELERLLEMAKQNEMIRIHATKGKKHLRRRKMEQRLKAAVEAKGPVSELQAALEGAAEANVPPSLVERGQALLARLQAVKELADADASGDWERLDKAIGSARAASVDDATIAPHLKTMLKLRAGGRLKACLAKGEDGYKSLQAVYDDALAAELSGEADVDEARRLLDLLANAQRFFRGAFEEWMGGGYDGSPAGPIEITSAPPSPSSMPPSPSARAWNNSGAVGGGVPRWLDNPQFRMVIGDTTILKMSVSVDKAGDAAYCEYAVHVIQCSQDQCSQVGPIHTVVASTGYLADQDHEGSTASVSFEAEAGATYFVVPSTKLMKQSGGFSVTTIGVGSCKPLPAVEAMRAAAAKPTSVLPCAPPPSSAR